MKLHHLHFTTFIVTLLLVFSGCEDAEEEIDFEEAEISKAEKEDASIRYLALGDSYTIGSGVSESDRWPVQLAQRIEQDTSLTVQVDIIAQTGWTTSDLLRSVESNNIQSEEYNLVSLLIGVNNQFQDKPFAVYETEFDSLLQTAIDIAGVGGDVFVVSIPDYGVTAIGKARSELIAREIDEYNNHAKLSCNDAEVTFIEITSISRELGDSSGALAGDNLHPSGYQYSLWVDRVLPRVLGLIKE